jgi:Transposase DNA-binding/Transposase Tn5 dimerisation domain
MELDDGAASWAVEELGQAELGDKRRTTRVVSMASAMAMHPAGKVTQVFPLGREREGAYRLLNNEGVPYECLVNSAGNACAQRSCAYPFVFVPVDGTSATFADPHGKKDFGSVGTYEAGARGIKAISAIALSPAGEPLGLCAQRQWTRLPQPKRRSKRRGRGKRPENAKELARAKKLAREKQRRRTKRPVEQKETQHWIEVIEATKRRFAEQAPETRCWFQLDREADAWPILKRLPEERLLDWFTVRGAWNRRLKTSDGSRLYLRDVLVEKPVLGGYGLHVPARKTRTARRAHIEIRVASVVVDACDQRTEKRHALPMNVVWAREVGTAQPGEKPIEWLLLTNHAVDTLEHAQLVVFGYAQRWKIEEVHKTWKSGQCQVEQSQLHTAAAAMKWATLLFAVAVRTERIKHLARSSPELPASVELSPHEIRALILLKRRQKARTETVPDTMPTIAQAARWIADLGGYTGKSSGGPFGSITLGRGLVEVIAAGKVIQALDLEGKLKM